MTPFPATGARYRNPFLGETFIFTHMDEAADACQFDCLIERGGMQTGTGRQHFHPNADEIFTVVKGSLKLMVDGRWEMLGPGEARRVPRGTPHLFRNGHDGETLVRVRFEPGADFLRYFLNMAMNLTNHPEWYDEQGEPPLLLTALRLHAYRNHAYGDGIPVWFQKLLFAVLSPVARLRGYRLEVAPRRR